MFYFINTYVIQSYTYYYLPNLHRPSQDDGTQRISSLNVVREKLAMFVYGLYDAHRLLINDDDANRNSHTFLNYIILIIDIF